MRIQEAPARRNFQGTFVVTAAGAVSSARIAHYQISGQQYERIESLDGQPRHVYRHNDLVYTLWPDTRTALVEQRDSLRSFPALLQDEEARAVDLYDVRPMGVERIAGREADVINMTPRDALRFGYRLWADRESGLLLRADVLNDKGERLESSAFSEVSIGVRAQPQAVLVGMKKLDGYRVVRPVLTPTRLEDEGWALRQPVPGFRAVHCVKRPLAGMGEPEASAAGVQVMQAVYSDGLTYVSVFVEPYSPERHRPMLTSIGATHTLMKRKDDWWFTVVGDVPAATLRAFVGGLVRTR
jgi:sigma-E factor negative regulatory protein RseB